MVAGAEETLSRMTVKSLRALAADYNIELRGAYRKAAIVDVLASHEGIEAILGLPPPASGPPPPPGWEPPPPPDDLTPSEPEEPAPPAIDLERLDYAPKAELVELAEAHGVDSSGGWMELKERLVHFAEALEAVVPSAPPEAPAVEETDVSGALMAMTVKDLRTLASDQGIDLRGARRKADIVEVIAAAPNVMDAIREGIQLEEAQIEVAQEALDQVEVEVEEIIEEVVDIPSMEVPGADEEIAQGLNIDVDFGGVEDLLDQARMRFEESNFDRAGSLAEEGLAIADIAMAKFQRSALAYTLTSAQRLIEEAARAGHEVEDVAERLVEAKKRYSDSSLMEEPQIIRELLEYTRRLYSKDIHRAREAVYEAQDLVADAEGLGADVSVAHEFLRQARLAVDRMEHAEAVLASAKAKESAEESRLRRIEDIQGAIPATYDVIQEARNVGSDVYESERLIKQAEIALEAKDFVLVSELVKRAERSAMESQHYQIEKAMELRRRQVEKAHAIVADLEPTLIQARRMGIDVSEAGALLSKAREVLQEGDYVNGTMYAKEALELVRKIAPQLEEAELTAGVVKPTGGLCRECRSRNLVFYDNGWGKCMDCSRTFQWRRDEQKTMWGKFKDLLKE